MAWRPGLGAGARIAKRRGRALHPGRIRRRTVPGGGTSADEWGIGTEGGAQSTGRAFRACCPTLHSRSTRGWRLTSRARRPDVRQGLGDGPGRLQRRGRLPACVRQVPGLRAARVDGLLQGPPAADARRPAVLGAGHRPRQVRRLAHPDRLQRDHLDVVDVLPLGPVPVAEPDEERRRPLPARSGGPAGAAVPGFRRPRRRARLLPGLPAGDGSWRQRLRLRAHLADDEPLAHRAGLVPAAAVHLRPRRRGALRALAGLGRTGREAGERRGRTAAALLPDRDRHLGRGLHAAGAGVRGLRLVARRLPVGAEEPRAALRRLLLPRRRRGRLWPEARPPRPGRSAGSALARVGPRRALAPSQSAATSSSTR